GTINGDNEGTCKKCGSSLAKDRGPVTVVVRPGHNSPTLRGPKPASARGGKPRGAPAPFVSGGSPGGGTSAAPRSAEVGAGRPLTTVPTKTFFSAQRASGGPAPKPLPRTPIKFNSPVEKPALQPIPVKASGAGFTPIQPMTPRALAQARPRPRAIGEEGTHRGTGNGRPQPLDFSSRPSPVPLGASGVRASSEPVQVPRPVVEDSNRRLAPEDRRAPYPDPRYPQAPQPLEAYPQEAYPQGGFPVEPRVRPRGDYPPDGYPQRGYPAQAPFQPTPKPVGPRGEAIQDLMTSALQALSKELGVVEGTRTREKKVKNALDEVAVEEIQPQTMNDILVRLIEIDPYIEASSLVKRDGTILASAISRRITDTLFATIATTLGRIGEDMIRAVESGEMKYISLHGETGILYLAPVLKDILLVILTSPRSKSGIVNVAVHKVRGLLRQYLGLA
ncbi:MAG: roadblock/LC7 domain-containing protein, partial [Promethearchaeota archaeon]